MSYQYQPRIVIQVNDNGKLLKIENCKIFEIPKFFFSFYDCNKCNQLILNLANLKVLRKKDLSEFRNLKRLQLIVNKLIRIDEELLNVMKQLKYFILEAHNLTSIPTKLFYQLKLLQNVVLIVPNLFPFHNNLFEHNPEIISFKIESFFATTSVFLDFSIKDLQVLDVTIADSSVIFFQGGRNFLNEFNDLWNFKMNYMYLAYNDVNVFLKLFRVTITQSALSQVYVNKLLQIPTLKYANINNNYHFHQIDFHFPIDYQSSLHYLNLSCNMIQSIIDKPFQVFKNLEILDLSGNRIDKIIDPNIFTGLNNLKILNLQSNQIILLNVLSLIPLENLEVLNFTWNLTRKNVLKIYKCLPSLKRLYLCCNKVKALEHNPLKLNISNCLQLLDLQYNKIERISDTFFQSLINLKYLYLNSNLIETLNSYHFQSLHNLEYLNLSHNRIEILDDSLFLKLSNLKILKISNNNIWYLHTDLLKNLQSLQLLDLSNNKIVHVSSKIFKFNRRLTDLSLRCNSIIKIGKFAFINSRFKCIDLTHNLLNDLSKLMSLMETCIDCLYVIDKSVVKNREDYMLLKRFKYVVQSK